MLRTYLYIPEELHERLKSLVAAGQKTKAGLMRQALEEGIKQINQQKNASAEILLRIAEIGKKHRLTGPKDASQKHDEYFWKKQ